MKFVTAEWLVGWPPSNDFGGHINLHNSIRICMIPAEVAGPTERDLDQKAGLEADPVGKYIWHEQPR